MPSSQIALSTSSQVKFGLAGLAMVLIAGTASPCAMAAEENASHSDSDVSISGEVNIFAKGTRDVVAIGGEVEVSGKAGKDMVAIGGLVKVDAQVEGEAVIGGGEVNVSGSFAEQVVLFGGMVHYEGINTEEMVAFGGEVVIDESAVSGGPAMIFGGRLNVDGSFANEVEIGGGEVYAGGNFAGETTIAASSVEISGSFAQGLEVEGKDIVIRSGAIINGALLVRSPNEPVFEDGVEYQAATYTYEHIDKYDPRVGNLRVSEILGILTGVLAVVMVFMLFFAAIAFIMVAASRRITPDAAFSIKAAPLKAFLIGLLACVVTGFVGAILIIILIGPIIPLMVSFIGFFVAGYTLSAFIFKKVGEPVSGAARLGYTAMGGAILIIVSMIPVVGSLIAWVATVLGVGGYMMAIFGAVPEPESDTFDTPQMQSFDDGHPPEPVFEDDDDREGRQDQ